MRRLLFSLSLALFVAVPASQWVVACGDKFLQTGRGLPQNHYAPRYSASVLVFAPSRSGASLLEAQKLQSALKSAGHRLIKVVQDEAGVSQALRENRFDLVLVGQDDLAVFGHATHTTQLAPTVLPVMNKKATKTEMAACKQQYDCQLKTSDRLDDFLKTMDDAMKVRTKAAAGTTR